MTSQPASDGPRPRRRPVPDSLFGGRLRDAFLLDLEVVRTEDIAPHVRSLTVASSDLLEFEFVPGQDLMIEFPDGDHTVRRRYTIRRADPVAGTVDLEFEIHDGDGVAARWVADAGPGGHLDAIGPRGAITLRSNATSHLFVADDSAMPAVFAMIEARPEGEAATVVLVTPHGAGSRPGPMTVGDTAVRWVEESQFAEALTDLGPPPPGAAAYVMGERGLVSRVADSLVAAGLDRLAIASKAYWRGDQPNAAHGEPARD